MVHYQVLPLTYENEANYFTFDCSNQTIDDPILLDLIRNENILVTPHIAFSR